MRAHLLVIVAAVGCGETQLGPFQPLPIETRFEIEGNDGVVHVARDRAGVAHVYARTVRDLGFAQGYVMAHDRLPQMELLRRMASGTLAAIYGRSVIDIDVEMRFHRIRYFASAQWEAIKQSDFELADLILRFTDGVNTYIADHELGVWTVDPATDVDPALRALFASQIAPWQPEDSVAIMRFYTFAQSWTALEDLDRTELDVKLRRTRPAGLARDLIALAPIPPQDVPTPPMPAGPANPATRPPLSDALFAYARTFLGRPSQGSFDPRSLMRPNLGSSAFVVGPELTSGTFDTATSILAADMHVALTNPSIVYPMHQIVEDDDDGRLVDVLGLFVPGVPVAIAGTNGLVGWAPTLGTHDVNDLYYEEFETDGTTTYTKHTTGREEVTTFVEMIDVAGEDLPEIRTFEVSKRGPIIPNHPSNAGISIAYTGYAVTHELSTLWFLGRQASVGDASDVLQGMQHGPHYLLIDNTGGTASTAFADVPLRPAAARQWNAQSPDAAAPFFVLDGTNAAHDWEGLVPREDLPVRFGSYVIVADADPSGATADGQPLDAYLGVSYAAGLRERHIARLIERATIPVDPQTLTEIQHDTLSVVGERLRDAIAIVLGTYLESNTDARITTAHEVMLGWTFATPVEDPAASSAATLLFNTWMHFFIQRVITDDLSAAQYMQPLDADRAVRIVHRLLVDPATLELQAGQPLLCGGSCAPHVIDAMRDAVTELEATGGVEDWQWGRVHALKMRPLFPDPMDVLALPRKDEAAIQLAGDMFSVARADGGWESPSSFTPRLAVGYRMLLVGNPVGDPLRMELELPTGTVLDTRDPHYRDLLERYLAGEPVEVPLTLDRINELGENRWEFR